MFNKCCELLAKEKIKIAFFESASAGYLAYRFSLSPYSGDILIGSLVSYDLRVKENTLHISEELIEKYTAVHINNVYDLKLHTLKISKLFKIYKF